MDIRFFYLVKVQFIIRNYQIKKPLCPISNASMYTIAKNTKSAWTWTQVFFYLIKAQFIIRNYQINNPYVQFQMLQCTISSTILNQLGHGFKGFLIWSRFNSLSEITRSKNPYVQFQMLQCTISSTILNQLGHGHKGFLIWSSVRESRYPLKYTFHPWTIPRGPI
jgi:hypothetical protein